VAEDDGFVSRWAKRKAAVRQGAAVPAEAPKPAAPVPMPMPAQDVAAAAPSGSAPAEPSPPTLDDVAQLNRESDYSRFVAPDVDAGVKNAAMKKLFADPHFNQMDGLDVYIDDYNKFEPIPKQLLRQLVNARVLGLLDDELEEQPKPDNPAADENADLQLQPDDAAGGPGLEPGAGPADDDPHDAVPPRSA
jgi:hypothetical protein